MSTGTCPEDAQAESAHRILWFAPDRPVEGATIFLRPVAESTSPSLPTYPDDTA